MNQLLNVTRSSGAVADAVAQNSAANVVGEDLSGLFTSDATAQSIDNALAENVNALNTGELESLRSDIESNGLGTNTPHAAVEGESISSTYDRRAVSQTTSPYRIDPQTGMVYDTRIEGRINTPRLPIEDPLPADRLMRSRDQWRFSSPRQSNLHQRKMKFKPYKRPDMKIIKPY